MRNKSLNRVPVPLKNKAFTLVELIVVITILAILWTIAFISLQWYSRDARDSKRAADINNIKTSIELYSLQTWKDPIPDSYSTITYSGWTEKVWYQWVVWDHVTTNLKQLNEKPLDPLTNDPYVYSVTNSYKEYEVLALYEWSVAYNQIPSPLRRGLGWGLIPAANAATTTLTPKIVWNYNWVFVKTNNYIIPTPSIVIADPLLTWTPISLPLTPSNIKSLVMTNGKNIPKNSLNPSQTWWLDIKLSVYTWSITSSSSTWAMISAVKQIQWAYTWTTISSQENIAYILNQTTNDQLIALWNITILKWQKSLINNTNTTIIPAPAFPSCTASGQIKTSVNTYWTCSAANIIVCSWNWTWYEIAACNVWTSIAWTTPSSYWDYYQFGRNQPYPIWANWDILWNYDWKSPGWKDAWSANDWWVLDINNFTSSYKNSTTVNKTKMQWPCISWYHVPTQLEWHNIFIPLWTSQIANNITNQLKLPMWGYIDGISPTLVYSGSKGYYWSSSPVVNNGVFLNIISTAIYTASSTARSVGIPVRCFKN